MKRDPSAPGMLWLFFSPSGRIGRQPYALAFLFWIAVTAFCLAKVIVADSNGEETASALWVLAFTIAAVASTISLFFLSFKRLHDMGFSGLLAAAVFVPVLSFVTVIILMAWPGTDGTNAYGVQTNRPK